MHPHSFSKRHCDFIADIGNDIRLAVDTGKVTLGHRAVMRAISENGALAVVIASKGKKEIVEDITHLCTVSQTKLLRFSGNSLELGALCGKPYSVNALVVLDAGSSNILKDGA
jgi:large subunit ribosomal protein L30e